MAFGQKRRTSEFWSRGASTKVVIVLITVCVVLLQIDSAKGLKSNEVQWMSGSMQTDNCQGNRSAVSASAAAAGGGADAGVGRRRRCLKKCRMDEDCKGRGRRCLCDGLCGWSCVKTSKRCQLLSPLVNGGFEVIPASIDGGGVFGSKVVYSCQEEYTMMGQSVRFCQGDGSWTGHAPSCVTEGKCRQPPVVTNGKHNGPEGRNVFDLGTQFIYTCANGFYVRGFFRATCVGEGRWTGPRMVCSPRSCNHPGDIPNGHRLGDEFFFSRSVQYSCLDGYELVGEQTRTCLEDGRWSNRLPFCRPVKCGRLEAPLNGYLDGTDFSYGSMVRFSCKIGFRLIGSASMRCLEDKTWSGKAPSCTVLECSDPGPFYNGYIDGQLKLTYGSTLTFRCFSLAKFDGPSSTLTCMQHGNWSHPIPTCLSDCKIPSVENGTLNGRRFLAGKYINHGQEISYICNEGFIVGTDKQPKCINGSWTFLPQCKPAPCTKRPPDINNGMTRFHSMHHGDRARYWCSEGYSLVGNEYLTCEYGQWTGEHPYCNKTICPFPGTLDHGKILIVGVIGKFEYRHYVKHVWHSTRIQFTCDRDYELRGPQDATCVHNRWSPAITTRCVPKQHPELPMALMFRGKR